MSDPITEIRVALDEAMACENDDGLCPGCRERVQAARAACDRLEADHGGVFAEIAAERQRQDAKWGGHDHDDTHGWHEWIDYIAEHAGKAYSSDDNDESYANARRRYIEVAALAVAAVESMDRTVLSARPGGTADAELPCTSCGATPETGQTVGCPECEGIIEAARSGGTE